MILERVGAVNLFTITFVLISVSSAYMTPIDLYTQGKLVALSLLTPSTTSLILLGGVVEGVDNLSWVSQRLGRPTASPR